MNPSAVKTNKIVCNIPEESAKDSMNTGLTLSGETYSDRQDVSSNADETRKVPALVIKENDSSEISRIPLVKPGGQLKKNLLVLDVNGLLVDIVSPPPKGHKADATIARRAIFKRPFYLEFLNFCFEKFEVAIWSSRTKKNVDRVIANLMGGMNHKLLFCWDLSQCTVTSQKTLENKHKALVFKDLRKIWEKHDPDLPWEKGYFNESNTLLLDDSPYKALLNPLLVVICENIWRDWQRLKICRNMLRSTHSVKKVSVKEVNLGTSTSRL